MLRIALLSVVGLSEKDLTSWYISQLDVGTTDAAQELILLKHVRDIAVSMYSFPVPLFLLSRLSTA